MADCPEENIKKHKIRNCTTITYQEATVRIPVTVRPIVKKGESSTFCCGEPIITPNSCSLSCRTKQDGSCSYIITQNICIEVPIDFSACVSLGNPIVECKKAFAQNDCLKKGK